MGLQHLEEIGYTMHEYERNGTTNLGAFTAGQMIAMSSVIGDFQKFFF